jgi:hypothetical protein
VASLPIPLLVGVFLVALLVGVWLKARKNQ